MAGELRPLGLMIVARQFIAWSRSNQESVPEGLNDRSQAIYCLEQVQLRIRPVGDGMIGSGTRATIRYDKSTPG